MRKSILLIFNVVIALSCTQKSAPKEYSFKSLRFTAFNLADGYQLIYKNDDTLFLHQTFPSNFLAYCILDDSEKEIILDNLIDAGINSSNKFNMLDTGDGQSYTFHLEHNHKVDSVTIHEGKGPKKLYDFADDLIELKNENTFIKIKYHPFE